MHSVNHSVIHSPCACVGSLHSKEVSPLAIHSCQLPTLTAVCQPTLTWYLLSLPPPLCSSWLAAACTVQMMHPGKSCERNFLSFLPSSYLRTLPVYAPVYIVPALLVHRANLLHQ